MTDDYSRIKAHENAYWYVRTQYKPYYCIVHVMRNITENNGSWLVLDADKFRGLELEDYDADQFISVVPAPVMIYKIWPATISYISNEDNHRTTTIAIMSDDKPTEGDFHKLAIDTCGFSGDDICVIYNIDIDSPYMGTLEGFSRTGTDVYDEHGRSVI